MRRLRSRITLQPGNAAVAALLLLSGPAAADNAGHVSCSITENGQAASGVISVQRDDKEISTAACGGKELSVPAGTYTAALRLDGALDGPERKQPLVVQPGATTKLSADFATGILEVRIASLGKRAAGIAIIKRAGQQLGTLGSGVTAHLSAGTYRVFARYRSQERDLGDVVIAGGQRVTLDANFRVTRALHIALVCLSACASAAPAKPSQKLEELNVSLARSDGARVELAALSGKPTLLFLFATYDQASQLALVPLLQLIDTDPRVSVLGVALQPDAKAFLDMYKRALSIPFELFFDPDNQLLQGRTALGRVAAVPLFVALDAQGRIRDQLYGAPTGEQLRALADRALAR